MGAMRAILDSGLRIPEDVAIVGCGNFDYDDLLPIPLTSVDQDSEGLNAAKLGIGLTKRKPNGSAKNVVMPVKLVVRASTKRSEFSTQITLKIMGRRGGLCDTTSRITDCD
jgi:LacI family transcriptional regulator